MTYLTFLPVWRKRAKLSQWELAQKLKIDRTLVSEWETGKKLPDIETRQKIADLVGQPLTNLWP